MSEQQAEPISAAPGFHGARSQDAGSSRAPAEGIVVSPRMAEPIANDTKYDLAGQAKADAAKLRPAREEASRDSKRFGNMSSGYRAWEASGTGAKASPGSPGKRLSGLAAVAAVAALTGALGNLLVTSRMNHPDEAANVQNRALEASVDKIDAALQALKDSVENSSRLSLEQLSKASEGLERLAKAQADPASKLGRLSEALELLRDVPPPLSAASTEAARIVSKDPTGSITPPPVAVPKSTVARLPTLDGWWLRRISGGVAVIEGHDGVYEVRTGELVPGLGRVDAIRRQDGRWVVVTGRGLVVGR